MAVTTAALRVRVRLSPRPARRHAPLSRPHARPIPSTASGLQQHTPTRTKTAPGVAAGVGAAPPPRDIAPTTNDRPPSVAIPTPRGTSRGGTLPSGRRPASAAITGTLL